VKPGAFCFFNVHLAENNTKRQKRHSSLFNLASSTACREQTWDELPGELYKDHRQLLHTMVKHACHMAGDSPGHFWTVAVQQAEAPVVTTQTAVGFSAAASYEEAE
jgi:hypothetical protein